MTWKMRTWKMHNMENERIRIAHMEKGRIFSQWKLIEKAQLENAQHGKCTSGKR